MEKSSTRSKNNVQIGSELSRKPVLEGLSRVASTLDTNKSEICVSGKERTPDLSAKQSLRGNIAELMKFGPVYGSVPSPYFDQFSGLPMQHPLYVGAMFPPMPLPEAPFPYYPYMYPPAPFALGNPHVYAEAVTAPVKRERPGVETDRKEYRDTEPETRDRNESSSKKDENAKPWRAEAAAETTRKESVIKSVVKESVENGKASSEQPQRGNREARSMEQRSVKMDYPRKDDREGMVPSSTGKFSNARTEERPARVSPPNLSRAHDVTARPSETSHQSFVQASPVRSKTMDNPHYTNGSPGYSYISPPKLYDPASPYRLYGDKRIHDVELRDAAKARHGYWDTSKDDRKMKNGEDKSSELRINGVKESPEKVRDVEETRSRASEDSPYMKYLKRDDRRFYDEGDEKHLRYTEELVKCHTREQAIKLQQRLRDERERSPPSANARGGQDERTMSKSSFPVTTAHSVETIMNGRLTTSPAKPSDRAKEDTRARSEWNTRRTGASDRVPKIVDGKRTEVATLRDGLSRQPRLRDDESRGQRSRGDDDSRGQRSREVELHMERSRDQNVSREQRSRDQSSKKEQFEEMERVRDRYESGRPFFDPRFMNPGMVDHRGIDSRLYAPNMNPVYQSDTRGFDPRKYDSRMRERVEVKNKRNFDEQTEEKPRINERQEERIAARNESSNDRLLPEQLRVCQNDEGRPRSAPQCGTRSISPRLNGADGKRNEQDKNSRGLEGTSRTDSTEAKRGNSGNATGQAVPSRRRSPVKDEPGDDVIVSKDNAGVESSHAASVSRPGTNSESNISNAMRASLGNLMSAAAATGYPNVPMINPETYFQQLLMAQNEGRLPMFLPMPNGVFPHAVPELMDPLLHFSLQRLAQEKALLAGKDLMGYSAHLMSAERQRELQKNFTPQQLLELQRHRDQLQLQQLQQLQNLKEKQELSVAKAKEVKQEQKGKNDEKEVEMKELKEQREQEAKRRREEEERQAKTILLQKQFQEQKFRQQQLAQKNEQQQQQPKAMNAELKNTPEKESKPTKQQLHEQQTHFLKQWQQREQEILQRQQQDVQQTQQLLQQQSHAVKQRQQNDQDVLQQPKHDGQQRLQQQNLLQQPQQRLKQVATESEQLKMMEQRHLLQQWQQQQQQKQELLQLQNEQRHLLEQNKQAQPKNTSDQAVSYENSTLRTIDSFVQDAKDMPSAQTDFQKANISTSETLIKEERSRFQFPEPRLVQEAQLRRASLSPPGIHERVPTFNDVESTARKDMYDVGELSPNCVSAAEVLSRFRTSSSLRFFENEEKAGMEDGDTGPPTHESDLSSSTPQGEETRFTFYENAPKDKLVSSFETTEPVERFGMAGDHQEQMRCRGDISELLRAVMSNEEQRKDEVELDKQGGDPTEELYIETRNIDEDLLSDGCDAGELSPLSDYGDNDCWWWITRSPCVPSARRIPQYLEDKENLCAQRKRNEKHRQNICENINRRRKEAKRGLTKATKERYATLANHKLTCMLDAESVLNAACSNIKAATEIDGLQVELRDQLLNIQRTYRERHRELARLTPKNKEKHEQDSPVKRGPGRPRKRKNFSNSKSNANNEPDGSAANSPAADQLETGSLSPVATPVHDNDLDPDDESIVEEQNCDEDPAGMHEDDKEVEGTQMVTEETPQEENENEEASSGNTWELGEQTLETEGGDNVEEAEETISKKKLKKKRRRIISDSDAESSTHFENCEKPKKAKKSKKASKSKTNEGEEEVRKNRKMKQNDDDVFTSDNGEQGLNLLAKYSVASRTTQDEKVSTKKRKRSTISDDAPASKQRTQKKKPAKLSLKSPPKDSEESTNAKMPTKPSEQRAKDSEQMAKKAQIDYHENFEKSSPEKFGKTKAVTLCLPTNDEFFPRRSERIFLSSSSSLNSPTTFGSFEIPAVSKKKGKTLGKIVKKKDQESPDHETTVDETTEKEASSEKENAKKKRKVKMKQEEKRKKKLKCKRNGSVGELTDEEYDEQTFVEEIKQLPKRNRQAPRRYIEYDSGEEKHEEETSSNEQPVEEEDNCESDGEKTRENSEDTTEPPKPEPSEQEPSGIETETTEQMEDEAPEEESTTAEENQLENVDENEDEMDEEKETACEDELERENGVDDDETKEEGEIVDDENEKDKPPYPWMFSMAELVKGQKMLLPVEGVYYPGRIDDIHVPDLYAIILEGERGRRPGHFRSSEQLLTEAVKDVQPKSLDDIPIGKRVCAYWSLQYRCFYPGLVSEVPEDEKIGRNCCWVEFDDGDSGEFPLPDVRMIPPDFPQEDCESNSGLPEPRPKKSELDDVKRTGDDGVDDDLVSDYGDSAVENGHVSDRSRNERDKRRRDKKEYSKTIGRRTDDEYDRPKTTKYRSFSVDSECSKSGRSERNSGSKKKVKTDVAKEFRSHDRDEGDTRDDEGEMELNRDVFSDDGPLRRKRFTKYSPARVGGSEEPEVLVYPPDRIWRWAGKPCPNRRKRGGRKVFYKSIYRGDEHISVGECAVFLSSPSKNPNLPYVGKIIKMWERFNGSKVVRVKWFYHPEETKAGRRPSDGKNGLYLSSHVDENDVQTIAHKCEVLQLHDSKNNKNPRSTHDSDSDVTNNNIFWCLGTYDPLTETFPSDND